MANKKWVADAREVLLDVERIYDDHYFRSNDQTVHDIFNAFRRIIRRHAVFRTVEVVHGEWTIIEDDYEDVTILECSVCEMSFRFDEYDGLLPQAQTYHYCPNCGAKMDGDDDDNT